MSNNSNINLPTISRLRAETQPFRDHIESQREFEKVQNKWNRFHESLKEGKEFCYICLEVLDEDGKCCNPYKKHELLEYRVREFNGYLRSYFDDVKYKCNICMKPLYSKTDIMIENKLNSFGLLDHDKAMKGITVRSQNLISGKPLVKDELVCLKCFTRYKKSDFMTKDSKTLLERLEQLESESKSQEEINEMLFTYLKERAEQK